MIEQKKVKSKEPKNLQHIFLKWLFFVIIITFILTATATFYTQTRQALQFSSNLMEHSIEDVFHYYDEKRDDTKMAKNATEKNITVKAKSIAEIIAIKPENIYDFEILNEYAEKFEVPSIHITDEKGVVIASTTTDYIGYDLKKSPEDTAFLEGINNKDFELIQEGVYEDKDGKVQINVAVARLDAPGVIIVSYYVPKNDIRVNLTDNDRYTDVYKFSDEGAMIFCNAANNTIIQSSLPNMEGKTLSEIGIDETLVQGEYGSFTTKIENNANICRFGKEDGLLVITALPKNAVYEGRSMAVISITLGYLLLYTVVFLLIQQLIKRYITSGISQINVTLDKIAKGALHERIHVTSNKEFIQISSNINKTVDALNIAIENEASRIDQELKYAKIIQMAALPKDNGDFGKNVFEIASVIYPAKEVGGDFFDYFMIDEDNLAVVIADVSGKGIPAALYMMSAKDKVRNALLSCTDIGKEFELLNKRMCNEGQQMFITVFAAVINFKTNEMRFVNAGHNSPLILNEGGEFEYMPQDHDFVLAGLEQATYKEYRCVLQKGSCLFLYTDGVSEAMNEKGELYGENRLLECLNKDILRWQPLELVDVVKASIDEFAKEAQQADDITMVVLSVL